MCTGVRFSDDEGNMYFGRNLDWSGGYGQHMVITPRGYEYNSAFLSKINVKYAVMGMALVEENIPLYFDCANEAGLAVAGLSFAGYAKYEPREVEGRINIAVYEFPLWVAMNFKTVAEAKTFLKKVAIIDRSINAQYRATEQHWLIGDNHQSIVVEYTKDGMKIYDNDVDTLTNQPEYSWHRENLRNYMNLASPMPDKVVWRDTEIRPFGTGSLMRGIPGDYYSPSRFVRAAYFNTHYPIQTGEDANVGRMFHTLASVAMIEGAAMMNDGSFEKTIYTSVFSAATDTYYYNTYEDLAIKSVTMGDYDLDELDLIEIK